MRRVKFAATIVCARTEKVRQDVIFIRGANQFRDRHAQLLGEVTRQNIAEVTGRHADIKRFAFFDLARFDEFRVGANIVHDLRQ